MNREELKSGASAGFLAATASSGALVALGMRTGSAARPFNVIAAHLLGGLRADVWGFVPQVTIPGIVLHLLLTTLLGIVVHAIVRRDLAPAWLAATAAAVLCGLVSIGIARRGGSSLAQLFPLGDLLLFYITLAVTLAIGMRFAFFGAARDSGRHMEPM